MEAASPSNGWTYIDEHVLVFNDLHIALAVSRAGDPQGVGTGCGARSTIMRATAAQKGDNNRDITVDVGRRLIDGVLAFAQGDYARTIEAILPVRYKVIRIGGSHAQRDIVTQTLIAAAERSGQTALARALLAERLAVRPTERTKRAYAKVGGVTMAH